MKDAHRHRRALARAGMALLAAALPMALAAQSGRGTESRAAANRAVARSVASLMDSRYVLPEVGRSASDALRAAAARGDYDRIAGAGDLASALADQLRRTAPDGHLTVFVDPAIAAGLRNPPAPAGSGAEAPEPVDPALRRGNYGVRRVEVLAGNVGYLELREFAPESRELAAAYGAAMTMLAGTDAVIIDLRQNGGGHGSAAALLAGHWFAGPTHLLDTFDRPTARRTAWRTPRRRCPARAVPRCRCTC